MRDAQRTAMGKAGEGAVEGGWVLDESQMSQNLHLIGRVRRQLPPFAHIIVRKIYNLPV
jgi:hypothetical protein